MLTTERKKKIAGSTATSRLHYLKDNLTLVDREEGSFYYEQKFVFPRRRYRELLFFLEHYAIRHPNFPSAINITTYFDSPDLKAFWQTVEGDSEREKIRLRCYGWNSCFFSLEKKIRKDYRVYKKKWLFQTKQTDVYCKDLYLQAFLVEFFSFFSDHLGGLFCIPVVDLWYRRERFILPDQNIRLNVDSEITCFGLYRGRSRIETHWVLPEVVVELKSSDKAYVPHYLSKLGGIRSNFSKYTRIISCFASFFNISR